ncbi:MAG: hypothetical protein IPJ98_12320 [Bryobacterales bacterium]|nr:hypothetical protein [Bryobacterales bacterium]
MMKSRASSSEKFSPQGFSRRTTLAPWRLPISVRRSQKKPLARTAIFEPSSMKLETQASMPALPVPEMAMVNWLVVPKAWARRVRISSEIWKK